MQNSSLNSGGLERNLAGLETEAHTAISLFFGVIGYVWGFWLIWPVTGSSAPLSAWLGAALLIFSVTLSYLIKERHPTLAKYLLVYGVLGVAICTMLTFRSPGSVYLFILPISFASVLMRKQGVIIVAGIASLAALITIQLAIPSLANSTALVFPGAIILLVTMALWLSARNLYTALEWVWSAFQQARENEQLAREQQAELRRTLKALDEASYRIQRANHLLGMARSQAEEARKLKQQFAQTISHELRTPINLVVGFTELMIQSPEHYGEQLPPAYGRDLTIVHRNASHLQSLVNDVLDLARIEAAQMRLTVEKTDPLTLVQEAVNTVRSLVESRGLTLQTELPSKLPPIWVDSTRIRQVLFNLINNAVRFTEEGSITVGAKHQTEKIVFTVKDTGVGIKPEDIPRLFEEFQQLDGTTRRHYEGAGLGLAISHRFVKLHGGDIWVESEVGKGSIFSFCLPTGQTDPESMSVNRLPQAARWSGAEIEDECIQLAVTGSPSAAALLTRYMPSVRTVTVQSLDQAHKTAQQLMPQAVIIDQACEPQVSANLNRVAQEWGLPQTYFIACPLPGEEVLSQKLAVNGYLVKPISRENLWDTLRRFGEKVDRVLVVDDDRDFVRLLRRMLESRIRRYQVSSALRGREALEMMSFRPPDLVLLDLMLPDISGLQVIEEIRANPKWNEIPIVVVSAHEEEDNLQRMQGAITIAKTNGLVPGEVIQCIRSVLNDSPSFEPAGT